MRRSLVDHSLAGDTFVCAAQFSQHGAVWSVKQSKNAHLLHLQPSTGFLPSMHSRLLLISRLTAQHLHSETQHDCGHCLPILWDSLHPYALVCQALSVPKHGMNCWSHE